MQQGRAPQGMRVKLRCKLGECRRHGIAKPRLQETATAGSGTLGSRMSSKPALEGRYSPVCFALPGLDLTRSHPGLQPLRVLRPGLCCTALSALVTIPVSLTRMPARGGRIVCNERISFAPSGLCSNLISTRGSQKRSPMAILLPPLRDLDLVFILTTAEDCETAKSQCRNNNLHLGIFCAPGILRVSALVFFFAFPLLPA